MSNTCNFRTSEASTKAWFRTKGLIDKNLNIPNGVLAEFRKQNAKWSEYSAKQYGISGMLFTEDRNGTKALPNKEMFYKIDAAKGVFYPANAYLQTAPQQVSQPVGEVKEFKNSLFRGQENEPVIDSSGNLVLVPTYDSLFKSEGVSFAEDEDMAHGYGLRYSKNPYIIEIDADYANIIFPLDKTGGTKSYGKRVIGDQGEQRFVSKEGIIIPKGKYKITRKERRFNLETLRPDQLIEAYNKQFIETDIAEYNRYEEFSTGYATEGSDYYDAVEKELLRRGITKDDLPFLKTPNAVFSIEEIVADAYNIKAEPGELIPNISEKQIQEFLNKQSTLKDILKKASIAQQQTLTESSAIEVTKKLFQEAVAESILINQTDIDRFNTIVERSNGLKPSEFYTSDKDFDFFTDPDTPRTQEDRTASKWLLNEEGVYDLVDQFTGEIYLRNVDLSTGKQVPQIEDTTPVNSKERRKFIKSLVDGVNEYRLDEIMAERGYDINEIIDNLEAVTTQKEFVKIVTKVLKNIC